MVAAWVPAVGVAAAGVVLAPVLGAVVAIPVLRALCPRWRVRRFGDSVG